jgi:hypothetical protein
MTVRLHEEHTWVLPRTIGVVSLGVQNAQDVRDAARLLFGRARAIVPTPRASRNPPTITARQLRKWTSTR